jgi:hypothetical protein
MIYIHKDELLATQSCLVTVNAVGGCRKEAIKEKIEKSAMPSSGTNIPQGCRRLLVLSEERLQRSFIL